MKFTWESLKQPRSSSLCIRFILLNHRRHCGPELVFSGLLGLEFFLGVPRQIRRKSHKCTPRWRLACLKTLDAGEFVVEDTH